MDRLEVVAVTPEGCAPLDGPLAAFNYFSFADRATYLSYGAEVVQILARRGARIIATGDHDETLEAPRGEPATGGAYVHEEFAVPLYPSAAEFMDMISSPEFQSIVSRQQAGARQEDYVFGFQKCLAGCDSGVTAAASDDAPLLLHVFRYEGADIESAIRSLEGAAGAPEMVYAGRLVGRFQVIVGGANLNTQNLPWGDGAVVFRFDSREAARAWTNGATFRRFRENTAEDVLVLLGSAAIAGG